MIHALLNLIAPEDCLQCGSQGLLWCDWCRLDNDPLPSRCYRCQAVTSDFAVCSSCKKQTSIRRLYMVTEYTGVPKMLIKKLKFQNKRHAAPIIAQAMADMLPVYDNAIIVGVPTASVRVRQRGFDHVAIITKELSKRTGIRAHKLFTKLDSKRQVGASRQQRLSQVKGAYRLKNPALVRGKNILLVDDVVTSGATLSELTTILKQAGAKRVDCVVFAYSKI